MHNKIEMPTKVKKIGLKTVGGAHMAPRVLILMDGCEGSTGKMDINLLITNCAM